MATYRTPSDLAAGQRRRFANAKRSMTVANRELAKAMQGHAIRLTSGNVSTETLRKLGHPFARQGPGVNDTIPMRSGGRKRRVRVTVRGVAPLLPINKQTGRLQRSLRIIPVKDEFRLQFTAPYARYALAPTKFIVNRNFWPSMRRLGANEQQKAIKAVMAAQRRP